MLPVHAGPCAGRGDGRAGLIDEQRGPDGQSATMAPFLETRLRSALPALFAHAQA